MSRKPLLNVSSRYCRSKDDPRGLTGGTCKSARYQKSGSIKESFGFYRRCSYKNSYLTVLQDLEGKQPGRSKTGKWRHCPENSLKQEFTFPLQELYLFALVLPGKWETGGSTDGETHSARMSCRDCVDDVRSGTFCPQRSSLKGNKSLI